MTDGARFKKKKKKKKLNWRPKFGPKLGSKLVFCHLKFGSLVFLEIVYSDRLQQFLTSSGSKIHEKSLWGPNLGQKGPKSGPELAFLPFSQVWFISFP